MSTPDLRINIARRIAREGPLSIAAFMAIALHDPEAGYYARRHPIGAGGDFVTAPEISQIFGELIGLWCAELWQRLDRPRRIILAELGPGRGTLMRDLLRAAAIVPGFCDAAELYLVETSPLLRAEQARVLAPVEPRFVTDLDGLPEGPLLVLANEFLDALPIRQMVRTGRHWSERLVGLDPDERLVFVDGPESPTLGLLAPASVREAPVGTVFEICPAASALAVSLGTRLAEMPGAALFVDYGYFPSAAGATFAALRGHAATGILDAPGTADLSAHVDFSAFAAAAKAAGAAVHGPVTQGRFLAALGAETRLARLSARGTPAQRTALATGLKRLIDPDQMGTLFKALALTSPGLPAPAGFE